MPQNGGHFCGAMVMAVIGIGSGIFVIFVLMPMIMGNVEKEQTPMCESFEDKVISITPIYSVKDDTAIEGSFFLGCGRIDTYMTYLFYTGDDTNGFQRQMIDATNVYVYRDSETPQMIKKRVMRMKVIDVMTQTKMCSPIDIIELHVPKNTLIQEM
jgi:hypothetical protein